MTRSSKILGKPSVPLTSPEWERPRIDPARLALSVFLVGGIFYGSRYLPRLDPPPDPQSRDSVGDIAVREMARGDRKGNANPTSIGDTATQPEERHVSEGATTTPGIAREAVNRPPYPGASASSAQSDTPFTSDRNSTGAGFERQLPLAPSPGRLPVQNVTAPAAVGRSADNRPVALPPAFSAALITTRRSDADLSGSTFPLGQLASLLGRSSATKTTGKAKTASGAVSGAGLDPVSIAALSPTVSLSSFALLRDLHVTGNGATYTWGGNSASLNKNDWGVASNWSGNVVPGSSDTANFANISTGSTTPTLVSASQSVNGLTFASNANVYTIGGNSGYVVTIGSGGITQGSSNLETINGSGVVLGANQTWLVGSGGLTVSAPIGGSGSLTKTGTGMLTLTGADTYSGGTTVNGGTLTLSGSGSLSPDQAITVSGSGATLDTGVQDFNLGNLATGSLTINNGGTVYSSVFFLSDQRLGTGIASISGYGSSWTAGDTLYIGSFGSGTLNITGGAVLTSEFAYIANGSSGTGSTTYLSSGVATVSGNDGNGHASTWNTGANAIYVGALGNGTLNITNGGKVNTSLAEMDMGTAASGSATLIINGGTLTTAGFYVDPGATVTMKLTNPTAANGGGYALNVGAGNQDSTLPISISDAAAGDGASGSIAGGPGGAGGIDKTGSGALTLGAANTFSGGMQIDGGSIVLGNSLALQNSTAIINVANGLNLNGLATATLGGLSGSGALALGNTALTLGGDNASTTYSGVVSGAGSLTKTGTGTLTLTGASTYSGGTAVDAGTVALSGSGALYANQAFSVTGSGSTLSTNPSSTFFFIGDVGTGSLTVTNGGSFVSNSIVDLSEVYSGKGTALINGYGSNWTAGSNQVIVGNYGTGTLSVTGGGSMTLGVLDIGAGTVTVGSTTYTGTGVTTVSGTDGNGHASTLNASVGLSLGSQGNGALNVTNGGIVTAGIGGLDLGDATPTTSAVIVNGGRLTTSGITVGSGANPTIKLTNPTAANGGGYALNIGSLNVSSAIPTLIADAAAGDGASGSIAGGPGGAGGIDKTGTGTLTLSAANTFSGGMQIDGGSVILGNSLALQNSTAILNVANGLNLNGLSSAILGGLSGSGALAVGNTALTVGKNSASTTYSGALSGSGSLTKTGAGILSLTGSSPGYIGSTTISQGTLAARGTSLGTGQVTVSAGGTLAVGEAANTGAPLSVSTLTLGGLTVTPNLTQPELTFNLGASTISDSLTITSGGTFSTSGIFEIGFASATDASLGAGTYTLMTFTSAVPPTLADYHAVAVGNLADINTGANAFSYSTNGNIVKLLFTITSADVTPEPSSFALLALAGVPGVVGGIWRRRR